MDERDFVAIEHLFWCVIPLANATQRRGHARVALGDRPFSAWISGVRGRIGHDRHGGMMLMVPVVMFTVRVETASSFL